MRFHFRKIIFLTALLPAALVTAIAQSPDASMGSRATIIPKPRPVRPEVPFKPSERVSRVLIEVKNEMASPFAGAYVEVDGKRIGISDELGRAYASLAPGDHDILAYIPGFQYGRATVKVPEGGRIADGVEVLLARPDLEMKVSAVERAAILSEKAGALWVELRDRKRALVAIDEVIDFALFDLNAEETTDLTRFFLLEKGRLRLHPESVAALRIVLAKPRDHVQLRLRARVRDFEKRVVDVECELVIGRYVLSGRVLAPAGKAGANRSLTLRVRVVPDRWVPGLKTDFYVTTPADGSFRLVDMPFGRIEIASEYHASDPTHFWSWWVESFGPARVELRPESLEEMRAGKSPLRYLERKDDERFIALGKHRKS